MDDRCEAISLGAGWIRHIVAETRQALQDFPVALGVGTALGAGLLLLIPLAPPGIALLTFAMVLMLGTLSWAALPERISRLPIGNLILLGVALLLMQMPLFVLMLYGGPGLGMLLVLANIMPSGYAPALFGFGSSLLAYGLLFELFMLGVCFAPHLIAAHRLSVPQALYQSLMAWIRNPVSFLVFLGCSVFVGILLMLSIWAMLPILAPFPGATMLLTYMLWVAGTMALAAVLVGFGRAALPHATSDDT